MSPEDVGAAVDALLARVSPAGVDAATAIAHGRRRVLRRRLAFTGASVALIVSLGSAGLLARDSHLSPRSRARRATAAPTPSTTGGHASRAETLDTTRAEAPTIAIGSPRQISMCGEPFEVSGDGGTSWRQVRIPAPSTAPAGTELPQPRLCAAAPGAAWLVRATGGRRGLELVRIRVGGHVDVTAFPTPVPTFTIEAIEFVDADVGWALGRSGGGVPARTELYATHDGGKTWELRNARPPIAPGPAGEPGAAVLALVDANRGWALGSETLETTNDGGRTWRSVPVPTGYGLPGRPALLNGVFAFGRTVVAWGGRARGTSYEPFFALGSDGGRTWALRFPPSALELPTRGVSRFAAVDARHWRLLRSNGDLWATDDGGRTWSYRPALAGRVSVEHMAFSTPDDGWISGTTSPAGFQFVQRTTDGGRSWTNVSFAPAPTLLVTDAARRSGQFRCPTRPLTPAPPGDPPTGVVAAARRYLAVHSAWASQPGLAVTAAYPVGYVGAGAFGNTFIDRVAPCGRAIAHASWVVEVQASAVVLAHHAVGWRVFGRI